MKDPEVIEPKCDLLQGSWFPTIALYLSNDKYLCFTERNKPYNFRNVKGLRPIISHTKHISADYQLFRQVQIPSLQ